MIDDKTYVLPLNHYTPIRMDKKLIILGHTYNRDMRHYQAWLNRYNGKYSKTAAFTISREGVIYEHFEPYYYSNFLGDTKLDKQSIVILLENVGWLEKDNLGNLYNWLGDIYNSPEEVIEKKWRNHSFWAPYTENQVKATEILVDYLCLFFKIPKNVISHNTKIEELNDYNGIIYRSNISKNYTDLSPSWDFESFKEKFNTNEDK